jgi:bacterioferritin-associated ferredoxin
MIVCLCRGVSDRQIVEAVHDGARSLDDVARRCDGAGTDCGSCRADIAGHLGCCRDEQAA